MVRKNLQTDELMVTEFSLGRFQASQDLNPIPPGKAQKTFGSSHTNRSISPASGSREHRPQPPVFLPVKGHRHRQCVDESKNKKVGEKRQ
jgi:hypothetical protein